jgi:hypothetical protein
MRGGWIAAALLCLLALHGCAYPAAKRAQGWTMVETEHIRLRTPLSRDRATAIAREMQRVRDVLAGAIFGCAATATDDVFAVTVLPARRFKEIARPGVGAYQARTRARWLADFHSAIVMRDDLGRETRQVFQHELTHRLMHVCLPRAPTWLEEGLASLVETAVVEHETVIVGIPAYILGETGTRTWSGLYRGVDVTFLSRDHLPRIRDLMNERSFAEGAETAHGARARTARYAAAWALVHMLMVGDRTLRAPFIAFQNDLLHGREDPEDLLRRHFDVAALQARLDAYVARERFTYVRLPIQLPPRVAPRIRSMSSGEGHLQWAWLWTASRMDEAPSRRRAHLDAAIQDPGVRTQAYALSAMLRIRLGGHVLAGAERAVDDGLALEPDAPALLHAKVDLLLARRADPSAPADRLRRVARGAEQLCTVAEADLVSGRARQALALAAAALERWPGASRCRHIVERARAAIARAPGA